MALTGNIEVFPLPEVLRLLARSGKNGCLRVESGPVDGRIYIREGSLSLATVATDQEFVEQVMAAGVVDARVAQQPGPVDLGDHLAPDAATDELTSVVREHVVEALYRIRRPGTGRFEFQVDSDPRFLTGQRFDIETTVADADRRAAEWAEIEQVIDDMQRPVRMAGQLLQDEVTISSPTWRVLASLEGGTSIADVALRLGTTQFQAAREIASLMRSSLVDSSSAPGYQNLVTPEPETPQDEPPTVPAWGAEPPASPWAPEPQPDEPAPRDPWSYPTEAEQESSEITASEITASEITASEITASETTSSETTSSETTSSDDPATDAPSRGGWWAEAMGQAEPEVDTDEFLESVFSDSEAPAEDETESGFSMGLLRRRRMGPVARDMYGN